MKHLIPIAYLALVPVSAFGISPSYLAGTWCYSHYEAGSEREDQNITYIFNEDGTLLYQNASGSSVDKQGAYEFNDGVLRIKPALMFFKFTVKEQSPDRLVLDSLGEHVFLRDECQ